MGNPGTVKEKSGLIQILVAFFGNGEEVENKEIIEIKDEEAEKNNISEKQLKELKKSLKERLKVIENNYGITPKMIKEGKRVSTKIQETKLRKEGKVNNIESKEVREEEDKIQEI